MSQDNTIPDSVTKPLNVILGGAGIGLLVAATAFALFRSQKHEVATEESPKSAFSLPNLGKPSLNSKWALTAAIRLIEHDASRKMLLTALKAMAKRAK